MTKKTNNGSNIRENSLTDYINLFKNNIILIITIATIILAITTIYALVTPNIYSSTVPLKVSAPKGNVLSGKIGDLQDLSGLSNDRYIANEIETINNSTILNEVAAALIDSFQSQKDKDDFSLIFNKNYFKSNGEELKGINEIARDLRKNVKIQQKEELDFIDITSESESPREAALIANTLAKKYLEFNLGENRKQVTVIREFLGEQLKEKQHELYDAEDAIKSYQLKKGGVQLDQQATLLVARLADFEAQKNSTKIDISISKEKLDQYKRELEKKDPSISNFLSNKISEPYLTNLQKQIADLETQRDVAVAGSRTTNAAIVEEYNSKIQALKEKLNKSMEMYRADILSSSPEEIKNLSQKIFEEQVNYQSLVASNNSLSNVINGYEEQFNRLPSSTLELARLERRSKADEQLYNTLDEKYQEAQLNEQATLGNVTLLNRAYPPNRPSKPNRIMIIILGAILGAGFAFGFVYIKSYFDKTIKSPEDIKNKNINVIAWIPKIKEFSDKYNESELVVAKHPDSIQSEAFKTIRTRIQFSTEAKDLKVILLTSAAPGEGKSIIATNLAVSFAQDHKKTVVIDCDLRKPRVHTIFGDEESAGFLNYFFGKTSYESIIKKTEIRNLDYITGGSIPPNPSEIIGSPG